jgi:hypothetical protein
MRGSISKGLLITLVFALIPLSAYGTNHAGPKTPSCGNYKVSTNEIIVGVKFPKGTYQINSFGISCTKVMGSKGLFAKFLKLKDKDQLPKPWRYLADAVGAPKFSSGPGVGFRVQLITATPTPTPTPIIPATIEANWQILYRKTLNSLKTQSIDNLQLDAIYSPTVNVSKANVLLDSFKDALALYVNRFGSNKKVIFLFMSENDKSWYNQKVTFYEGANSGDNWWGSNHCDFSARSQCGRGTNATPTNVFYEVVGSAWMPDSNSRVSPNHEAVHVYQKSIIGDGMYRILPPWFGEGQANFLGFVTSSRFMNVSDWRLGQIKQLDRGFPNYLQFKSNDWLDAINRTDGDINFCVSNGLGYSLGMLMSEYLYRKFTPEQVDRLLVDVAGGITWDAAIFSNFGLTKSQLYKDVSEYVYAEVQGTLAK